MAKDTKPKRISSRSKFKVLFKALSLIIAAAFIVTPSILHSKAGIGFSPILTGSMRPYANPGDMFITKTVKASELKVGDIISVHSRATGVFYAHRVTKITTQSGLLRVVTKGDANSLPEVDPFMVAPFKPVSKNIMRVKYLGRPLIYLTSIQGRQAGLGLMVIANLLALLLFLFRKKVKADNPLGLKVYKDLYREAVETKDMKEMQLQIFKNLFEESQEEKKVRESEMAEMLNEMKLYQLTKGN